MRRLSLGVAVVTAAVTVGITAAQERLPFPDEPLHFGPATARFHPDRTFSIRGQDWPELHGTWIVEGAEVVLALGPGGRPLDGCNGPGRYGFSRDGRRVRFTLVSDECPYRRMILDGSTWRPAGDVEPAPDRRIVTTPATPRARLPEPAPVEGSWPMFRGTNATGIAEGQRLPDRWDGPSGQNILWQIDLPGLAHSSPIVWGDRVFVTTAVSSDPRATFRPGLYGDGDASEDRSHHRWLVLAFDKRTGRPLWERVAFDGAPVDKRHIKSTYASATPATDGRIVVASFGSQGVYAYTVDGAPVWKVDLGRMDLGAYNIPTIEWGPASSPTIWNGLVFLQVDTHADSFVLALDAATGRLVWKSERDELPSWGTPNVAQTSAGPQLVTNASNFVRAYDPKTGAELWRIGRSSKITAPTPIVANDLIVVASGRAPERPIFVVRPDARGDLTLADGESSGSGVAWSRTGRGPYMPTPLAYDGVLYVLANNGVFDAYDLESGADIYRQRLPHPGSGFSASPVAADGRIYLSSEDGDMLVIAAGREFRHVATNQVGDLLMATPAISEGVMYVRSARRLLAIGERRSGGL
jgi:outer membrane protein assembly factor BamB